MGRRREEKDPDRFLSERRGIYQYQRRVPRDYLDLDERAPLIRLSLKTDDLAKARALRDIYERADNELWASLGAAGSGEAAKARYRAAIARAAALGLVYRPASEIVHGETVETILQRIESVIERSTPKATVEAALGLAPGADQTITAALDFYFGSIVADELRYKSAEQKRRWKNKRKASVATFVFLAGDKLMSEITRDDAVKVHKFWMARIAPEEGLPSHSASSGNRDMGNLRSLYRDWFAYMGLADRKNPFDGLSFSEKSKRSRPPFSVGWITGKLLAPGALDGLNTEARCILLAMVETGARLSELCNIVPEAIMLEAEVPHLVIEPRLDPEDPREIKTDSSIRKVPLVGVSLAAMHACPQGFPRYKDKEAVLSATVNKYLRSKGLLETPKHSAYSLRHAFEDRMKEAGFDAELRRMLMGHTIDRPIYGSGGSLAWKQGELTRIELPFDAPIVRGAA